MEFYNNPGQFLKQHIEALADPLLEGRLSGMPGAFKAADYLVAQLKSIGIIPMGLDGYLQPLQVPATRMTGPVTLKVGNWCLRHRIDFGEMRLSSGGIYSGRLLVIRDGEEVQDSLENKIVLIPQRPKDFDLESTVKAGVEMGIKGLLFEEGDPRWFHKTSSVFANLGIPVIRVRRSLAEELIKREGSTVTIELPIEIGNKQCNNILGVLPGSDNSKTVALTAHYDHIGDDPLGHKFPGVLDNASGVAVILELVKKLKKEAQLPYNLLVCFLTGEESGHWGAKHLIQHQPLPIHAIINFDVLGLDPDFRQVRIGQSEPGHWFSELTVNTLKNHDINAKIQKGSDDAAVFFNYGIPTIGFGEYNLHSIGPKIHTPDDRIEALHFEPLTKTIELSKELLNELSFRTEIMAVNR